MSSYVRRCARCGRDGVHVRCRTDAALCGDCRDVEPPQIQRSITGSARSIEYGTPPDQRPKNRKRRQT